MTGRIKTTWDQREALRLEWERNATATYQELGSRIGLTAGAVQSHAQQNGWTRTPEIVMQAQAIRAARNKANIKGAIERGYVPSVEAATAARLGLDVPVKYKKDRRYPCWDTRQKEKESSPPKRYSSVFDYAAQMA